MLRRHRITFPKEGTEAFEQDEAFFYIQKDDGRRKLRLHDYADIYDHQGLYEQLFYDRLKCTSPKKVVSILHSALTSSSEHITELRVLDFGAGNGIVGEELKNFGVSRLVGVDIIPEARDAVLRDRPGMYDAYLIRDFTKLSDEKRDEIASWNCDCMISVAALGFGDIPVDAFIEAFNIISEQGWVAFNIKETFLDRKDDTGFSRLIRELIFSDYLDIYHMERYRHRLSIEGEPLFYYALAGRKNSDVPKGFLTEIL
ncbi:MAG: methyltransferase [Acidobacteriota bacterium]|nr:MAG: methyltransferase [Acidobacteriota bacterium]